MYIIDDVVVVVVMMVVVVVGAPDVTIAARAVPDAESITATVGGVTTANLPHFSRKRRRSSFISFWSAMLSPQTGNPKLRD